MYGRERIFMKKYKIINPTTSLRGFLYNILYGFINFNTTYRVKLCKLRCRVNLFTFFIILTIINSCTKRIYNVAYPTLNDGKYDTEFPYKNCSQQLEKIGETVKLINSMAYYKCFLFPNDSEIKVKNINSDLIKKRAFEKIFYHNSA